MPAKPRPIRDQAGTLLAFEVAVTLPRTGRDDGRRRRYFRVKHDPARPLSERALEQKALREQGRLQARADAGEFSTARLTLGDVFELYLEQRVKVKRAPLTYTSYRQALTRHAGALRAIPLAKVGRAHLERFEAELRGPTASTRGRPLSSAAIALICTAVKGALNWAEEVEYLTGKNPARFWRVESGVGEERPGLSEEQAGRLLALLLDDPGKLPWLVLLTTNLRLSELRGLRWQDVDLAEGTYVVRQQVQLVYVAAPESASTSTSDSYLVAPPKRADFRPSRRPTEPRKKGHSEDRVRPVPKSKRARGGGFAGEVVDRLRVWQTQQKALKVAGGAYWRKQERQFGDLIFTKVNGQPLSPEHLRRVLNRLLAGLGIGRRRLHATRGLWASTATRAGVPLGAVAKMMGHSSERVTRDSYLRVEGAEGRDAAERVYRRLRGG